MTDKALHWRVLIGLLIGVGTGLAANSLAPRAADGGVNESVASFARNVAQPIGQVFLRLIFMVALPLVFTALTLGVAGMGDVKRLGRVGLNTLILTLLLSTASVAIGVGAANLIKPGGGLSADQRATLMERYSKDAAGAVAKARQAKTVKDTLLDIIPKNPLQEMVGALDGSSPGGGMLSVMFFALCCGLALTAVPERGAPVIAVLEGAYDMLMVIISFAMRLAPIGVAGLMFAICAELGFGIIQTLGAYMLTVIGGLATHMIVVYGLLLALVARMAPWRFFSQASEAIITAFATSSSNATLPTALRVAEHDLGIRRDIASFVLTVGSTANQNGTALFEGITVLFLAQVFGIDLTLQQQVMVVLMSVLAGVGTAGVPGGSLPLIVVVLQYVNIPPDGIGIIIGVDRVLDMCRTTVNVAGDLAIAACVNRGDNKTTALQHG